MFSDVSMIIPMKENSYMLDTILQYHAPTGMDIYILHDAKQEYTVPPCYNSLNNIHYFHLPQMPYNERVLIVLQHIKTKYCVFRADRRHQSNTSIDNALKFLRNNEDYSSASGIWFNSDLTLYHCSELLTGNGELDDVHMRLEGQGLSYQPPYYNVQRTDLIRVYFETLKRIQVKIPNIFYHEHVHAFLCFFTGKTKQFASLAGVIQNKRKPADYAQDWYKAIDTFQSMEDVKFVASILKIVLGKFGFSSDNVEQALQKYHTALALRFIIYRINMYVTPQEKVRTFGYMEDIFSMLNASQVPQENLTEKYLRVFMALDYDCKSNIDHVKHKFTDMDVKDLQNLFSIMETIDTLVPENT